MPEKEIVRFADGLKCPICGGADRDARHQGVRCHGFTSGKWVHCSREETAGSARFSVRSGTFAHLKVGPCPCGVQHAPDPDAPATRKKAARKLGPIDAVYQYKDADGETLFEVVRFRDPKDFRQRHRLPSGEWEWTAPKDERRRVLYRTDRLAAADPKTPVWIVEGEKDVHRMEAAGFLATTSPMGAGKWSPRHAEQLAGRTCYVVPDNDEPGRIHAASIGSSLVAKGAVVRLVPLPGLAEHGDVSDYLAEHSAEDLKALADKAPEFRLQDAPPAEDGGKAPPKIDLLTKLAIERSELWKTQGGDAYATVAYDGRTENIAVDSLKTIDWLIGSYYKEHGAMPTPEAINSVRSLMGAKARFDGRTHKLWLRVADATEEGSKDRVHWLDLCDDARHAVRVTAAGWEVVANPPVKFNRPAGMQPLPTPERGGSIDDLWEFVNVETSQRLLVVAVLTAMMRPVGPYPLLVLGGEQGSAKSTTSRAIKRLVDPRTPTLGSLPESPLDLWVVAGCNWLLTFDNISSINKAMSNALCQLALEGGFERRKLHTDNDVAVLEAMRPMILNGIEEFARAPDLVDRVVMISCPKITEASRRTEEELWSEFRRKTPTLLGALLDLSAGAMAIHPTVRLTSKPRMADFATWGEAVARRLGFAPGDFVDAFNANRDAASAIAIDDSPIAAALFEMGRDRNFWSGSARDLMRELRGQSGADDFPVTWPRSPQNFSNQLARITPGLRGRGVIIDRIGLVKNVRTIEVRWTGGPPANSPY